LWIGCIGCSTVAFFSCSARGTNPRSAGRQHLFTFGTAAAWFAVSLVFWGAAGCRTISTERIFREQARRHPGQVVWVRGAEPLPADDLAPELRVIGGLVRFWTGGSANRLRWKLSEAATQWGAVDAAYRVAREQGLWLAQAGGSIARLQKMLEAGAPVALLLERGTFWAGKPEACLAVGFDRADDALLCIWANGAREVVPCTSLERSWAAAGYRWVLVLPPKFDAAPLTPDERFERGMFHEWRGELERALADYQAASEGAARKAAPLVRQGNVLARLNRPTEAEAAYREAIRAAPESAQAYNNLAMLLADAAGRSEEAVKLARNALMLDPANPRMLDTLGYALYKSGATGEAADILERARGRARWLPPAAQAEIAVHLARVHLANGDVHLAREVLRDALQLAPEAVPKDLRDLLK
jgi:tetratricopeptide (TPR) repeat protein